MKQPFHAEHHTDPEGKPSGGLATATGIIVHWQAGPLGRGEGRMEPNGAFVETLIAIAKDRIQWYNDMGFRCDENDMAIDHLETALSALEARTARREAQGTEGTHVGT